MAGSTDLVERLYRRLVEAVSAWPPADTGALTIADLYQHLIPYRAVRGELGVLELAEYEDALLRLLVGEGGFVHVLDEDVQREIAQELGARNPILGIYRDYAAVELEIRESVADNGTVMQRPTTLRVAPADVDRSALDPAGEFEPTPPPPMPADALRVAAREPSRWDVPAGIDTPPDPAARPRAPDAMAPDTLQTPQAGPTTNPSLVRGPADPAAGAVPAASAAAGQAVSAEAPAAGSSPTHPGAAPLADSGASAAGQGVCVDCGEPLPAVEGLIFCPHCGVDQTAVACESCGSPIRGSWNFCIRCGTRRPAGPASS